MNLVKRPAVLTGFFMLVLFTLVFLRAHGWRVPVECNRLLFPLTPRTQTPEDTVYGMLDAARAGDTAVYVDTFSGPLQQQIQQADSRERKIAFCYLFDCAKFFISKRRSLCDRSAE